MKGIPLILVLAALPTPLFHRAVIYTYLNNGDIFHKPCKYDSMRVILCGLFPFEKTMEGFDFWYDLAKQCE